MGMAPAVLDDVLAILESISKEKTCQNMGGAIVGVTKRGPSRKTFSRPRGENISNWVSPFKNTKVKKKRLNDDIKGPALMGVVGAGWITANRAAIDERQVNKNI